MCINSFNPPASCEPRLIPFRKRRPSVRGSEMERGADQAPPPAPHGSHSRLGRQHPLLPHTRPVWRGPGARLGRCDHGDQVWVLHEIRGVGGHPSFQGRPCRRVPFVPLRHVVRAPFPPSDRAHRLAWRMPGPSGVPCLSRPPSPAPEQDEGETVGLRGSPVSPDPGEPTREPWSGATPGVSPALAL